LNTLPPDLKTACIVFFFFYFFRNRKVKFEKFKPLP
jgi:hypothetical protein